MDRSIFDNPKASQPPITHVDFRDGLVSRAWRERLHTFFSSLIPSHVPEENRIWLTTPDELAAFIRELREPARDLSHIEYVCITETIADIYDIVEFLRRLRDRLPDHARILYSNYNWFWAPLFALAGHLGFSRRRPYGNVYRDDDLDCFLDMAGLENVRRFHRFLLPCRVPVLSSIFDGFLVRLPLVRVLALNTMFIARKCAAGRGRERSVSVIVPCRDEQENVAAVVSRTPPFGSSLEFVFIDDMSTDGTRDEVKRLQGDRDTARIVLADGPGRGKGGAVRAGMRVATGDICMILDADLTVIPEDLPQFYDAMVERRADFIHGTRLVYPQEREAMRFANTLGNIGFSVIFSYILGQRTTDTLCGTKVFWRRDWPVFEQMRTILGDIDRWGDYNLIFGAARFGLKIAQLPVRYFERLEGVTKMNRRIRNGLIMLRVAWHALFRVKFIGEGTTPSRGDTGLDD